MPPFTRALPYSNIVTSPILLAIMLGKARSMARYDSIPGMVRFRAALWVVFSVSSALYRFMRRLSVVGLSMDRCKSTYPAFLPGMRSSGSSVSSR